MKSLNGAIGRQGQSAATIDKERRIGAALAVSAKIAAAKFPGFPFWCLDTNAGSGWNDEVGCPGSPLVFHAIADAYLGQLRPTLFACDWDKRKIDELQRRLATNPAHLNRSFLLSGDNEEAVELFCEYIANNERKPHFAVGAVIVDPNGYHYRNAGGEGAPIRQIPVLCEKYPRIDIILNLNMRTYRLQLSQKHRGLVPPEELLASLRPHWLVARPATGATSWLLAVGRSMKTGEHRNIGFHALESAEGRNIVNAMLGKRQGGLFDTAAD